MSFCLCTLSGLPGRSHGALHCRLSIADNLPVATRLEFYPNREAGGEEQNKDVVKDVQFEHGYRLGFVDNNKVWQEKLGSLNLQDLNVHLILNLNISMCLRMETFMVSLLMMN